MKKAPFTLLTFILTLFVTYAQTNGLNYKALITDNGNVLANQTVNIRFTLLENGTTSIYQETHSATTDANGIVSVDIGEGNVVSGDFATIDWSNTTYFLKVEIDTGSGYQDFGTSELKYVPYAKYAEKAGNVFSGDFNDLSNVPAGLSDGDDDTQLTEAQVDAYVSNNGYLTQVDNIQGIPVSSTLPSNGQVLKYNGSEFVPADDDTSSGSGTDGVVNSAAFSGTTTKTLTLSRTNGLGNITATFTDNDTQLSDTDITAMGYIKDANDADSDPTNELQTISKSGNTVTLSNGGGSFTDADTHLSDADIAAMGYIKDADDADSDPTNEIQTISKSGNTITLSNGGGSITDSDTQLTEAQVDAYVSNNGYLTQVDNIQGIPVSSTLPSNGQVLKYNGSEFVPADDDTSSGSGTDGVVNSAAFSGTTTKTLTLSRTNGLGNITATFTDNDTQLSDTDITAMGYIKDANDADSDPSNEIQNLTLSGTQLSISNGNSVDFSSWDTDASDDFSGNYDDLTNKPETFLVSGGSLPTGVNDDIYHTGKISIGSSTISSTAKLYIEQSGSDSGDITGVYTKISNTGSDDHFGTYNYLKGSGAGKQYGTYNKISNSGDADHYGNYSLLNGTGSGIHYGNYMYLYGSGTGTQYGSYAFISNTNSANHYGSFNYLSGTGTGEQYGGYNKISNSEDANHYGNYSLLNGNGSGEHYGTFNDLQGDGTGIQYGVMNSISNTGNESHYGSYSNLYGSGSGTHIGTYQNLAGTGTGVQYGSYNKISNSGDANHYGVYSHLYGSGSGIHFGNYVYLTGNGTGIQYGNYARISNSGSGTHYGSLNYLDGTSSGDQYGVKNAIGNSGNGVHYGNYSIVNGNGSGEHYGTYNNLEGNGTGNQYGSYNTIGNDENANHYGNYSYLYGTGSGTHYGIYNKLFGTGTGEQYGVYNNLLNTGDANHYGNYTYIGGSGTGRHYGIYSKLDGSGTGWKYGAYNKLSGSADGKQFGVYNKIDNSGNSIHYGVYSDLSGTGTGDKYGTYNKIDASAGGTHYAVYGEAEKTGSYAGYFKGDIYTSQKLKAANSGDADMKAYIYGVIGSTGSTRANASSSGFTSTKLSTGLYKITFNDSSIQSSEYLVITTYSNSSAPRVISVVNSTGYFKVYIYDLSGNQINGKFNFVVYKK